MIIIHIKYDMSRNHSLCVLPWGGWRVGQCQCIQLSYKLLKLNKIHIFKLPKLVDIEEKSYPLSSLLFFKNMDE